MVSDRGIKIEVVYTDADLIEVVIRVVGSGFSGEVTLYSGDSELAEAARVLAGFPTGRADVREVKFGAPGEHWADGAARLRFFCIDSAGHAFVEADIDPGHDVYGIRQRATIAVPTEAAVVDTFVAELAAMAARRTGLAVLRGIG